MNNCLVRMEVMNKSNQEGLEMVSPAFTQTMKHSLPTFIYYFKTSLGGHY